MDPHMLDDLPKFLIVAGLVLAVAAFALGAWVF